MKLVLLMSRLSEIIRGLKNKKAPGIDSLYNEHIKYGGQSLVKCLCILFNWITRYEYVPKIFKLGIIVPIPKGEKDKT